jgi:DNA-directed RNA polymerase specialized sigma24 family protein
MNFADTRWSLVLAARGDGTETARAALSDLCGAYYQPVCRFLRCEGHPEDEARELAHAFFARILSGNGFDGADPLRGRFRSFLLGALKHFLADHRAHAGRAKRGGGAVHLPLDPSPEGDTACAPQYPDTVTLPPDAVFDRQWALTLLDRALTSLEMILGSEGKGAVFTVLRPWLAGTPCQGSQAEAAASLGLTGNAFRVAVHRLRQRFRDTIRQEIAQTLAPGISPDEEFDHLRAALARHGPARG